MQVITGGDDNAIHITDVNVGDDVVFTPFASVSNAHTSTVTGVLSVGHASLLSVGIDQKIRRWMRDGKDLVCIGEGYTFVPDVCGIAEINWDWPKRRFVVFGTGMELIAWDDSNQAIN